ncbi:MAG: hypothetical protein BGO39_04950 [Chloroflexi bacterium 54-19]|nr:MAG: hypothetical protein BGO39_04950 [Chloroflexi bacterium 54-19]
MKKKIQVFINDWLRQLQTISSWPLLRPGNFPEWLVIFTLIVALVLLYFVTARPLDQTDIVAFRLWNLTATMSKENTLTLDHTVITPMSTALTNLSGLAYFQGHYYIDLAPGVALLSLPFYQVGSLWGMSGSATFGVYLMALAGGGVVLSIYGTARALGVSFSSARFAALSVGLTSVLWRQAGQFGPGVFTLLLLGLALWLVFFPISPDFSTKGESQTLHLSLWGSASLGFILGFAGVVDYPNLSWTPVFLFYLVANRRLSVKSFSSFAAGWLIGLIPLLIYNWVIFNRPWAFTYGFDLSNPAGRSTIGQFFGDFRLENLGEAFFAPGRGQFGPVILLFGLWGLFLLAKQPKWRPEFFLLGSLIALSLLFGLGRQLSGAWRVDFILAILPPLGLGVAFWHERFIVTARPRPKVRWLIALTLSGIVLYYLLSEPGLWSGDPLYLLPPLLLSAVVGAGWLFIHFVIARITKTT